MEARPPAPTKTRRGLVVLAPNDLNWAAVRLLLQSMAEVEIIADLTTYEAAIQCDDVRAPDAIVGAPVLSGDPTLALLHRLRSRWDGARVILLVDRLACDNLTEYTEIPDSSCLCWNDLTPDALQHCLIAALEAPLRMVSASVAGGVAAEQAALVPAEADRHKIPARAAAILHGLAAGLTEQQVAVREGISLRTVQRIIADLQAQFGARSLFALGRAVEQLGLLPQLSLAHSRSGPGQNPPRLPL